jgi:hypothetical protein
MEKSTLTEKQLEAHDKIDALFREIKELAKKDTEKAREKMMIALNIMKQEHRKLK